MSFRITIMNFDADRRDELLAYSDSQRENIRAIKGIQSVHVIEVGAGQSIVISRYDTEESAEASTEAVQKIFGGMAEFFTAPPERKGGPIMWEM